MFCWQYVFSDAAFRNGVIKERVKVVEIKSGYFCFFIFYYNCFLRSRYDENVNIFIFFFGDERTGNKTIFGRNLAQELFGLFQSFVEEFFVMGIIDNHMLLKIDSIYKLFHINSYYIK